MDLSKTTYRDRLINQLSDFTSIRFVAKTANNVIEKLLWISIAIVGTVYIGYTMFSQIQYWNEFPVLQTKGTLDLSNMTFPAITFCPKTVPQFGIVEGLGNYLDLNKFVPSEAIMIRNEAVKTYWKNRRKEDIGCNLSWTAFEQNSFANYYYHCCYSDSVLVSSLWCQVFILEKYFQHKNILQGFKNLFLFPI